MPILGTDPITPLTRGRVAQIPRAPKTLLEKLTRPLDILDIPGNTARSILAGELTEAVKTLSPFHNARRIGMEETVLNDVLKGFFEGQGISGFGKRFVGEVVSDPLTYVAGLGVATRTAQLARRAKNTRRLIKAFEAFDQVSDANRLRKEVLKPVLTALRKEGGLRKARSNPRSLITIGLPFITGTNKQLGSLKKVEKALKKVPLRFLESPVEKGLSRRKILLSNEVDKLRDNVHGLVALGDNETANRLGIQLAEKETELQEISNTLREIQKPTLIKGSVAKYSRRAGKVLDRAFRHGHKDKELEALTNIRNVMENRGLRLSAQTERKIRESVKRIRELTDLNEAKVLQRLTRIAERRNLFKELPEGGAILSARPDLDVLLAQKLQKIRKTQSIKLAKLLSKHNNNVPQDILDKFVIESHDKFQLAKVAVEKERLSLDFFVKEFGKISGEEWELINLFSKMHDIQAVQAQRLRIPLDRLNSEVYQLDYIRRLITPEARKLKNFDKNKYNTIVNLAKVRLGAAMKRRFLPETEIFEINKLIRSKFPEFKGNFFSEDVIETVMFRHREHIKSVHKAKLANIVLETHGSTLLPVKRSMSARKFLRRMGLTPKAIGDLPAVPENLRIPNKIVNDLTRTFDLYNEFSKDRMMIRFFNNIEKINAPFKSLLTLPFLAFHMRNHVSNIALNKIGGVPIHYSIANMPKAFNLAWHGIRGTLRGKDKQLWQELVDNGVLRSNFFTEFRGLTESLEQFPILGRLVFRAEKAVPQLENILDRASLTKAGKFVGELVENQARIINYLYHKNKGLSSIEAAKQVNRVLFDYQALTAFEKAFMRPSFLFYTWMRKNVPLQINTLITNPRIGANYQRLLRINDDDAPDYLRASGAIRLDKTTALGSLGLPFEDLNILNVSDVDPLFFRQLSRISQRIATRLSPVFRVAFEAASGETALTRRPLENQPITKILKENIPIARFFRTGERIIAPDSPFAFRIADAITGIRTYPVSITRAQMDEVRRAAIASGKFQRSGFLVLPKKKYKGDPEVEKFKKLLSDLNKRRRKEIRR